MSGISPNETLIDFLGRKPQPKEDRFKGFTGLGNDGYGSMTQGPNDRILSDGLFVNDPRRIGPSPEENLLKANAAQPMPNNSIEPIDPIRLEYNRLKKEAADMRANGFMGRAILPTENQTFEEYRDDPQRTYKETGKLLTAEDSNNLFLPMAMGGNGSMAIDPRGPNDAQLSAMASRPRPNGAMMTRPMRPGVMYANNPEALAIENSFNNYKNNLQDNKPTQPQVYGGK